MKAELKKSFKITGFVVFIAALISTVSPFVLPHSFIMQNVPLCEYKTKYNKECIACGLTGAFCEISKGNFSQADEKILRLCSAVFDFSSVPDSLHLLLIKTNFPEI